MFARLDNVTSAALQCLHPFSNCHVTAVVESAILQRITLAGRSKGTFSLSLNVFGAEDEGDIIGDRLADASAFLQHPCFLDDGYEYYNPQYFYPDNKKAYLTDLVGLSEPEIRAKRLSDEVEGVLASLDETSVLTDDSVDDFVLDGVMTPLKRFHPLSMLEFKKFLILSLDIRQPHLILSNNMKTTIDVKRWLGTSVDS
jgi:SWI/SNF-related matrix-associated actin-dependent regulator of chromatin subfamily A3